jgi:hypothetical protein
MTPRFKRLQKFSMFFVWTVPRTYSFLRFVIHGFVWVKVLQIAVAAALVGRDRLTLSATVFSTKWLRVSALVSSMTLQTTLPLRAIAPMTVVLPVSAEPSPPAAPSSARRTAAVDQLRL